MGNDISKPISASEKSSEKPFSKHKSTNSQTPLVGLPDLNFEEAEKDSIRAALQRLIDYDFDHAAEPLPSPSATLSPQFSSVYEPLIPLPASPTPQAKQSSAASNNQSREHTSVGLPRPSAPGVLRLSEIIDIANFPESGHVRSPSGNILDRDQYLAHPTRPLTVQERQQRILQKMRQQTSEASTVRVAERPAEGLAGEELETSSEKKPVSGDCFFQHKYKTNLIFSAVEEEAKAKMLLLVTFVIASVGTGGCTILVNQLQPSLRSSMGSNFSKEMLKEYYK